jgi:large subunit ribosomal protein L4
MSQVLTVMTTGGQKKGEVTLPASLFGIEPNEHVMYEAVRTFLANQRQGTVATRSRSEVSGGGKKPWRQKGTGRARAGSTRVTHWRGGGLAFGPKPRDHSMRMPRKTKRLALKSALSAKAAANEILLLEDFQMPETSTKRLAGILKSLGLGDGRVLLVVGEASTQLLRSARNIENLKVELARELNTYDLLHADQVVMTEGAVGVVEEVFGE